jgi:hypothetical protein
MYFSQLNRNTYQNIILTIIAVLLFCHLLKDLLAPSHVFATNVMPVQIESVRGYLPVAIKEPVSGYPQAVCVNPCK